MSEWIICPTCGVRYENLTAHECIGRRWTTADSDEKRIRELGEQPIGNRYEPNVGDRARCFIRYGQLLGGSIVEGIVQSIDRPPPGGRPWPTLGMPTRPRDAVLFLIGPHRFVDLPTVPELKGPICLEGGNVVWLALLEERH